MRIQDLLPSYLDAVTEVVDVTGPEGLAERLGLPDHIRPVRLTVSDAARLESGPGTVVLARLEVDQDLAALVRRLQPGAVAILVAAEPLDRVPSAVLLDALAGTGGQIVDAGSEDDLSVLVVAPGVPATVLAERETQLAQARRGLAQAKARAARIDGSATMQVGRAFVRGARRPAAAPVTVPRDLFQIWRRRRRGTPVDHRVVSVTLPAVGGRVRSRPLVLTAPPKLAVPRMLAATGLAGYERESLASFFAAIDVAGPGAVYDIGSNVGLYAALASALSARSVVAFEPTPALVDVSRRFAADNRLQFVTEARALGARNGTATFYLSDHTDSSNSLAEGFRPSSAQITVPVETLDSYVARTGLVPAVMKVDTEITEPDVLAGGAATIAEHRPWILCEVLAGRVEDSLEKVLAPFDYTWYPIADEVPYAEATKIVGDNTHRHLMWLFAPQPPGDDFWTAVRAHTAALAACTPAGPRG